jgi:Protein of unknown function (DUF559)
MRSNPPYDAVRNQFMHSLGIVVLRFRNDEVMQELNSVIGKIVDVIEKRSPHPNPPLGKGEGITNFTLTLVIRQARHRTIPLLVRALR